MNNLYYKQKLNKLIEKLFINENNARERLIENEELIFTVFLASKSDDIEFDTQKNWQKLWNDLNVKNEIRLAENRVISSFKNTILSKRNKTISKYLELIFEEYSKII
jgi:hypothetical protein